MIRIPGLGEHTIGKGIDKRGEYISYYDKYDLDLSNNQNGDSTLGIGKPFNVYDRIYLDDYYEVPNLTHATYLPEVTVLGSKKHAKWYCRRYARIFIENILMV